MEQDHDIHVTDIVHVPLALRLARLDPCPTGRSRALRIVLNGFDKLQLLTN